MTDDLPNKIMQLFVKNPGSDYSTNEVLAFLDNVDREATIKALDSLEREGKIDRFFRNYFMESIAYYRLSYEVICTVCGERYRIDIEHAITVLNEDGEDGGIWHYVDGRMLYTCQACHEQNTEDI